MNARYFDKNAFISLNYHSQLFNRERTNFRDFCPRKLVLSIHRKSVGIIEHA